MGRACGVGIDGIWTLGAPLTSLLPGSEIQVCMLVARKLPAIPRRKIPAKNSRHQSNLADGESRCFEGQEDRVQRCLLLQHPYKRRIEYNTPTEERKAIIVRPLVSIEDPPRSVSTCHRHDAYSERATAWNVKPPSAAQSHLARERRQPFNCQRLSYSRILGA